MDVAGPSSDEPMPVERTLRGPMPALDGLRGLAVLLVLAHNFNLFDRAPGPTAKVLRTAMNAGWVGVQLFFVLSGFLITGILLDTREAKNGYRAFLARRTLRIFPLYYAVLLAAFVVWPRLGPSMGLAGSGEHQAYLWLYVSNWVEPYGRSVALFPHFWSLAVEEQFYLLWPIAVRGLTRRGLLRFTVALVVLGFASRIVVRAATGNVEAAYAWTICRMDALALGALVALLLRSRTAVAWLERRGRRLGLVGSVGLAVLFIGTEGFPRTTLADQTIGYTAVAACFALWVASAVLRQAASTAALGASAWELSPLRTIGKYSYGVYVFHLPLHLLVGRPWLDHRGAPVGLAVSLGYPVVATAATLALAVVSYHVLERPFSRLKDRFVPG